MTDKETPKDPENAGEESGKSEPPAALPASVERALEQARAAATAQRAQKSGRWLALVPIAMGAIVLALMMPRQTPPDGVPLPRIDHRVTTAVARHDDELAAKAGAERLPGDVLSVGTALRDLNVAENADVKNDVFDARRKLDLMVASVARRPTGEAELLELRAAQTRTFLEAVAEWDRGGEPKDFIASGGGFVLRAQDVGWTSNHHLLLDDTQRRVAFKTVWNAITHLDGGKFALTIDEERSLYAFYIEHPRPPETNRLALVDQLHDALTPEACNRAHTEKARLEQLWVADKIKRLGEIDATYPTAYALGIVYTKAARNDLAVDAFTLFMEQHPDGPYSLRAKNHLKYALAN